MFSTTERYRYLYNREELAEWVQREYPDLTTQTTDLAMRFLGDDGKPVSERTDDAGFGKSDDRRQPRRLALKNPADDIDDRHEDQQAGRKEFHPCERPGLPGGKGRRLRLFHAPVPFFRLERAH